MWNYEIVNVHYVTDKKILKSLGVRKYGEWLEDLGNGRYLVGWNAIMKHYGSADWELVSVAVPEIGGGAYSGSTNSYMLFFKKKA